MLNPKLLTVAALAASLTLAAAASIGTAQEASKPAAKPETGMMGGGDMMGMMGMMGEMNRMMGNCNRMMESAMQHTPAKPDAAPEKKG